MLGWDFIYSASFCRGNEIILSHVFQLLSPKELYLYEEVQPTCAGVMELQEQLHFVGVCGLFVTSDTRVKPETWRVVRVSNSLGAYGMVASFLQAQ